MLKLLEPKEVVIITSDLESLNDFLGDMERLGTTLVCLTEYQTRPERSNVWRALCSLVHTTLAPFTSQMLVKNASVW